jgi:hypothetical protein
MPRKKARQPKPATNHTRRASFWDLDAKDLRPLAGALRELLRCLEEYQRRGQGVGYRWWDNDIPLFSAWLDVQRAVCAVESDLAALGLGSAYRLGAPMDCCGEAAQRVFGLWEWFRSKRHDLGGWGKTTDGEWEFPASGDKVAVLIGRIMRDLAELPRAPGDSRRPCHERNQTFLRWKKDEGMTPAPIRDRWNEENPKDKVTIDVVKKGLQAARRGKKK